jgi:hypothetical protein
MPYAPIGSKKKEEEQEKHGFNRNFNGFDLVLP